MFRRGVIHILVLFSIVIMGYSAIGSLHWVKADRAQVNNLSSPIATSSIQEHLPLLFKDFKPTPIPVPHCVYVGKNLCQGYDMGVDDSVGRRGWVKDMDGYMRMTYPGDLMWGSVFITLGPPRDLPRPSRDLSTYNTLYLELRGASGTECVRVGIKDNTDPDDGSETKVRRCVKSTEWEFFTFPLSDFVTADLTRLYMMTEFVFEKEDSNRQSTIDFRNIQYLYTDH